MNARQALGRLDFKDWNLSRVGQIDAEFMTVQAEELFSLATEELDISLNVNGNCQFDYDGQRYETPEDIENRSDIIQAMRDGKIKFEERPHFEWHCNDAAGEFLDFEMADMEYIPTKLAVKGKLLRFLAYWYPLKVKNQKSEQREFGEVIQHFHTHQNVYYSIREMAKAKGDMERFLQANPSLLNVVDTIEMESVTDSYGHHRLTLFYHTFSNEAVADIRQAFHQ